MNAAALLSRAARLHPASEAIRYGDRSVTYAELDARASSVAAGLLERGLAPGERVVLYMPNRPELMELLLACFRGGLVAVPVNSRLHPAEVAFIARDCGAGLLCHDESFRPGLDGVAAELPAGLSLLEAGALPEAPSDGPPETAPDDPAWLFYTSGTTGHPKGATLSHRNLVAMTMNCLADICSFQPEDVVLHAAPLTHGSGLYMLPALARGSRNVISAHPSFEPANIFELVRRERISVLAFLAPTMIVKLLGDPGLGAADLSSLRRAIYGGGPMYVEHAKEAVERLGRIWVQLYGQGESPMTGTFLRPEDHRFDTPEWLRRAGSIGVPRTDVELRVVDAEDREVAAAEVGEIVLRAETVMRGYWGHPEETAAALRGGWLHTGDLGRFDQDGYVHLVDRAKDMIVSGGSNVYAREVEEAILAHPAVREVAVIGTPDRYWGEAVHAVVVLRPGATLRPEEVVEHCGRRLASYKKPRSVEFAADLPKSAYGKVLKRELREARLAALSRRAAAQPPPAAGEKDVGRH